jgi:hypothetical protein
MISTVLMQVDRTKAALPDVSEFSSSISDHFQKGGSGTAVLLVILGIIAFVAIVYMITRRQERAQNPAMRNDPHLLFSRLLDRLRIPAAQKEALTVMTRDLRIAQPTTILISDRLFDDASGRWIEQHPGASSARRREAILAARSALFQTA